MKNLIHTLRQTLGIEDLLFLLGTALIYSGVAAAFGYPYANITAGALFVFAAIYASRGS